MENQQAQEMGHAKKQINPAFASWVTTEVQQERINEVRHKFDQLQDFISNRMPDHSGRYMALVSTKLEEACLLAIKGISKPEIY